MGFSLSGRVAAGVQDELLRIVAEQYARQLQHQQLDQAQQRIDLNRAGFDERRRAAGEQRERQARLDKLAEARERLQVLDALDNPHSTMPVELSADAVQGLRGTPFEARIDQRTTLPARATTREIMPFAGTEAASLEMQGETVGPPQEYALLRRTGPQETMSRAAQIEARERAELERLASDPHTPPKLRQLVEIRRAGIPVANVGPSILETPADRQAVRNEEFADWQRRERFQDSLSRGREQARQRASSRVTAKDIAEAKRQARRDAIAEYNALKDPITGGPPPGVSLEDLIERNETEYLEALESFADDEPGLPTTIGGAVDFGALARQPGTGAREVVGIRRVQPGGLQLNVTHGPQGWSASVPDGGARAFETSPAGDQPRVGEKRVINGQLAQWDGKGWLPVPQ